MAVSIVVGPQCVDGGWVCECKEVDVFMPDTTDKLEFIDKFRYLGDMLGKVIQNDVCLGQIHWACTNFYDESVLP